MSMDTIIFFYKKRGAGPPWAEPVGLKTYMLIRVPMDMGEEDWPGLGSGEEDCMPPKERKAAEPGRARGPGGFWGRLWRSGGRKSRRGPETCGEEPHEGSPGTCPEEPFRSRGALGRLWAALPHPLKKLRQRRQDRMRQRRQEREAQCLEARRRERQVRMGESMEALSREIRELAGEEGNCYAVYADSVEKRISPLWKEYFRVPRFQGYTRRFWVELLMEEAAWPRFVILGTADCLPELIVKYAGRMKSLRWVLPEGSCDQALQDFVEDFYLEYGLAVVLQTFHPSSSAPWRREGALAAGSLAGGGPVNILDFTGEPCLLLGAAEGSVWLDMMSMEEKKRRIEARGAGIIYFSLKEKWRRAQKRCNPPLLP